MTQPVTSGIPLHWRLIRSYVSRLSGGLTILSSASTLRCVNLVFKQN